MNIGFDLDKIFINIPPFIPERIIEFLYKEKANESLRYRIPSKAEQIIRIFSHYPLFRPPIKKNMSYIQELSKKNTNKYFLISSRFGFLKGRTLWIIKHYNLDKIFNAMYFNYGNSQPHKFKNEIINKLKLHIFVDDDLQLLEYLSNKNPKIKFFWLNPKESKPFKKNLTAIKNLSEIFAVKK